MIMNTQQLQYLIEIERTRSISQAAANLYMGQPNLSRLLRDMEASVGFPIFERTRKGVRPTEKGVIFLQHARNILREAEFMEQMGPNGNQSNRFRICLPRSYCYMDAIQAYLAQADLTDGLDAVIRECHPRQAMELVDSGNMEIAVIRYGIEYQDYFSEQAAAKALTLTLLDQVEYRIVLSADSPLARYPVLSKDDLESFAELLHRDTFYPMNSADPRHSRIYTVDRMAQLQLLRAIPNSFLWAEPLPEKMLQNGGLVQIPCKEGGTRYQNALVYKPQCAMSRIERECIRFFESKPL